ncbi:hypothetical protein [Lacrimispora sp. 38-1]|uniref:hypothetical protein n=1 Tax=Lacrimispora sp. 38-1 TaxID=3125778 RepID=UPI003CEB0A56
MKSKLLKIAMVICFMFSVLFLGQIYAFADEVKPVHEYTFDNDSEDAVLDSAKENAIDGTTTSETFVLGYNGKGRAKHFEGSNKDIIQFSGSILPKGAKSIRFKIRKEASTLSEEDEIIFSSYDIEKGSNFFIRILGSKNMNGKGLLQFSSDESLGATPVHICDGRWHDIMYTWDGTSTAKVYVDDMTTPYITKTQLVDIVHKNVTVGVRYANTTNAYSYLTADLDDVQIYDSVIIASSTTPGGTPDSGDSTNTNIPTKLVAVGGNSKVDLTWPKVKDATSYSVKRSTTAGGSYTPIATGITSNTYIDTAVTNGTTYYYVVTVIKDGSESWNSNEASATPTASTDSTQTGKRALLVITMQNGERKEYDLTMEKVNEFMTWYNNKPTSSPTYAIEKNYNRASFTSRKDYISYDQITSVEVDEYGD